MERKDDDVRICLISSHSGHFRELLNATQDVVGDCYYVTHGTPHTRKALADKRSYFLPDPHRSFIRYGLNAAASLWHLVRERPQVVISTGAGLAVPTLLLSKLVLRSRIVFVETAASPITPSRTGKFAYRVADLFLVQWESLKEHYPDARYVGLL